jgi:hypothetical protein
MIKAELFQTADQLLSPTRGRSKSICLKFMATGKILKDERYAIALVQFRIQRGKSEKTKTVQICCLAGGVGALQQSTQERILLRPTKFLGFTPSKKYS